MNRLPNRRVLTALVPLAALALGSRTVEAARVASLPGPRIQHGRIRVAAAPDDLLVATWADGTGRDGPIGMSVSTDLGQTWTPHAGPGTGVDARAAVSKGGVVDVIWTDAAGSLFHSRSRDSGATFAAPTQVTPSLFPDGLEAVRLAVSPGGLLAVAGEDAQGRIVLLVSDAGATGWGDPHEFYSNVVSPQPSVAWAGETDLTLCYSRFLAATSLGQIRCRNSSDAGATLGPEVIASSRLNQPLRGELAARGPGDLILSVAGATDVWVARSRDGGATWSPETALEDTKLAWTRPSVASHPTGETWAATGVVPPPDDDPYDPNPNPGPAAVVSLWTTADGASWRKVELPSDLPSCVPEVPTVVVPAWRSEVVVASSRAWTASPIHAWGPAVSILPDQDPAADLQLTRLDSGRLLATWTQGTSLPRTLLASVSGDTGVTWSAPAPINDELLSMLPAPDGGRTAAIGLPGGAVVVLWLSRSASGCAEVRVSRSDDGASFAPSSFLGEASGLPLSIARNATGGLVAVWLDGELLASRSLDAGRTWSSPVVVLTPASPGGRTGTLIVSPVASAPDGSLVVVAADNPAIGASGNSAVKLIGARSSDGGTTWSKMSLGDSSRTSSATLLRAGPRLVAVYNAAIGGGTRFVSSDSGVSWERPFGCWIGASGLTADDDGNLYWSIQDSIPGDPGGLRKCTPDFVETQFDLPLPSSNRRALVALGAGEVGILRSDWEGILDAPGVYFDRAPCADLSIAPGLNYQTQCEGRPITIQVTASAGSAISYQWLKDGVVLPGATRAAYEIPEVSKADAGRYVCVVTASCQQASLPQKLEVRPSPAIGNSLLLVRRGNILYAGWEATAPWYNLYWGEAKDMRSNFGLLAVGPEPHASWSITAGTAFYRVARVEQPCGPGPK